MKKTDLEKNKGLKINSSITRFGTPGRFGKDAGSVRDRREQRKLDQARGLLPFAVKLDGELIRRLRALAETRQTGLNDVVAELLEEGLAQEPSSKG